MKFDMKGRKHRLLPSILISFALFFMLCVTITFEIYCTNMAEYVFSVKEFMPQCMLITICGTVVGVTVLFVLPRTLYRVISFVTTLGTLMLFVQQMYLNNGIHTLAGDVLENIDRLSPAIIINSVVWIVVLLAAVLMPIFLKKDEVYQTISIIVAVMIIGTQTIGGVVSLLSHPGVLSPNKGIDETMFLNYDGIYNISKNRNVFVFCIDRCDEFYMEEIAKTEPEVLNFLEGFTWFKDNLSLYGTTFPSVAYMLTQNEYSDDTTRADHLKQAWQNAEPLEIMNDLDYSVQIYTDNYYAYEGRVGIPEYIRNRGNMKVVNSSPVKLSLHMIEVSLYRCFPLALKQMFSHIDSSMCNQYCSYVPAEENGAQLYETHTLHKQEMPLPIQTVDENIFSFIHVVGFHNNGYRVFMEENEKGQNEEQDFEKLMTQAHTHFGVIEQYIEAMKKAGVYENATIIITGDHSRPLGHGEPRGVALLVKPSGISEGATVISEAQVSHDNLWATIFKSEGIQSEYKGKPSFFDVEEGENQIRRYVSHTADGAPYYETHTFSVEGPCREKDSWILKDIERTERKWMD